MNPRDFFIHIHVPKTGGSTFNEILRRNFGPSFAAQYGMLNNYKYSAAQVREMALAHGNIRCVASHRFSIDLPWDMPEVRLHAIAFVRDPVERFLSRYFYHRYYSWHNWLPQSRVLGVQAFVRWALEEGNDEESMDGQTLFLTGERTQRSLEQVEALVDSGKLLLFPSERFDEACAVLERMFPVWMRNFFYRRRNVSNRDQPVPDRLREEIRRHQKLDLRLHELAEAHLARRSRESFPGSGDLERRLAAFR